MKVDIEVAINKLNRLYMEYECLKVVDSKKDIIDRYIRYQSKRKDLKGKNLEHLHYACIYFDNIYLDSKISKENLNIISTQFRLDPYFLAYLIHDIANKIKNE